MVSGHRGGNTSRPYRGGNFSSPYRGGNFSSSYTRGGRGGRWQPDIVVPTTPPPPLGPMIQKLTTRDLADQAATLKDSAKITDSAVVASFNWQDGTVPTILVPGRPARWTPLAEAKEIPDDNGNFGSGSQPSTRKSFRDENSGRYARHPMEPAVVATLEMAPELPRGDHRPDVVACGSTIGSLLRFVSGIDKPFRMLIETVGDTVFFVRRENSPTELIPNIQGYGHSFPEQYTTWDQDVKGSQSHQRMVRYRFGGMQLLVRSEGDGYIAAADEKIDKSSTTVRTGALYSGTIDDLLGSLATAAVSDKKVSTEAQLEVKSAGELVEQERVFDLKTRSIKKVGEDTVGEELSRLWVRCMSKFILAYHERGVFKDIRVMGVKRRVREWEAENSEALAKLAALVQRIADMARGREDGKLEVCYSTPGGALEIREQLAGAGDVLSEEVKAKWGHRGEQADEALSFSDDDEDNDDWYFDERKIDYGSDDDGPGDDFTACSADHCGYCGRCPY